MNGLLVWLGFTPLLTGEQISDHSTLWRYWHLKQPHTIRTDDDDECSEAARQQYSAGLNPRFNGTDHDFLTLSCNSDDECVTGPTLDEKKTSSTPCSNEEVRGEIVSHCEVSQVNDKWEKLNWSMADHTQPICELTNNQLTGAIFIRLMFHHCLHSHRVR